MPPPNAAARGQGRRPEAVLRPRPPPEAKAAARGQGRRPEAAVLRPPLCESEDPRGAQRSPEEPSPLLRCACACATPVPAAWFGTSETCGVESEAEVRRVLADPELTYALARSGPVDVSRAPLSAGWAPPQAQVKETEAPLVGEDQFAKLFQANGLPSTSSTSSVGLPSTSSVGLPSTSSVGPHHARVRRVSSPSPTCDLSRVARRRLPS